MHEYISRGAVLACEGDFYDREGHLLYAVGTGDILRIPAADVVEVRHGRWTWDGGEDMHYYCSLCHHNAYGNTGEVLDGEYKYCPSCGARMDGGQDDV